MDEGLTYKERAEEERLLDEALEGTFPASDPVSMQQTVIVGRMPRPVPAVTHRQEAIDLRPRTSRDGLAARRH